MIQDVLSVFDSAVQSFMQPIFVPKVQAGVRAFTDEVNRAGSAMNQHPDDYTLYKLGEFDDEFGKFTTLAQPEMVVRGKDILKG